MSSRKAKLTKEIVDKAQAKAKRYYIWDKEITGLALCIQKTGFKSYFLRYRNANRVERRLVLGIVDEISIEEVKEKAISLKEQIKEGIDPMQPPPAPPKGPQDLTFAEFAVEYIEKYAVVFKKEKSVCNDKLYLKNYLLPYFGSMKVTAINRRDVHHFHSSLHKKKFTANRCIQTLSKMMNLCEEWEYRPENSNPCKRLKKYKEEARERFLSLEEIGRLQQALDISSTKGASPYFVALIKLLLLTGARLSEITTCKWEYINFENKVIELPDSKTGKRKILLCERCVAIIQSLPKQKHNPYLIASESKPKAHLTNPKKAWKKLLKLADLENVRIHDLRHTNASISLQAKVPIEIISKRLGHTSIRTTMRYAHLIDEQIREATNRLSDKLAEAMGI